MEGLKDREPRGSVLCLLRRNPAGRRPGLCLCGTDRRSELLGVAQTLAAPGCLSADVSFSISPSNEYSGLISFRMDWLDLLAVQGTRKSLLQHHSSKASILQRVSGWTCAVLQLWSKYSRVRETPLSASPRGIVKEPMAMVLGIPGQTSACLLQVKGTP